MYMRAIIIKLVVTLISVVLAGGHFIKPHEKEPVLPNPSPKTPVEHNHHEAPFVAGLYVGTITAATASTAVNPVDMDSWIKKA
jgi:hypothetical protein